MARMSLSFSATVILQAVASDYPYGFDIMDATGLPSGTVYPALRRLESNGYVTSKWEKAATAQKALRPPRKYYAITRSGEEALAAGLKRYRALDRQGVPMRTDQAPRGAKA